MKAELDMKNVKESVWKVYVLQIPFLTHEKCRLHTKVQYSRALFTFTNVLMLFISASGRVNTHLKSVYIFASRIKSHVKHRIS
jgi:hypothetical protein